MGIKRKWLAWMVAAAMGAALVGCGPGSGPGESAKAPSGSPMKEGAATAPGDTNTMMAGTKPGAAPTQGAMQDDNKGAPGTSTPPAQGDKSDAMANAPSEKAPGSETESSSKPKGSS